MAIGGGDGSIVLTTKVDESGLKNGLSSIKSGIGTLTTAIAGIGVAMIGATAAVVKGAKDTAEYGDRVDKLSQKIGMSNESFQQWDYIMQINGASIETLQAGMKTLSSAAENGSAAFDKLGISQEEVKNSSPEQLFETTISKLQEMGEGTERTAIAAQLLGRSATELGPLLNQNAESIDELKQRAIDYGFVMSDEAVAASAAFTDSLTTLSMTTTGLKNKLMAEFLPSLTSVTDGLALLMTGDMSGLDQINEGITEFVNNIAGALPKIIEIGGSIISTLGKAIIDNLPKLINSGITIITQLATSIVAALPNLMQSILSALPTIIPTLINGLVQLIVILIAELPNIIQPIIDNLPAIILSITEAIINNLPLLIQASIQLVLGIVQAFPSIIGALLEAIAGLAVQIGSLLLDMLPGPVKDAFKAAWDGVKSIWNAAVGFFKKIWEGIKQTFSVVMDVLSGFFSDAWEGIKTVWDVVVGYFTGIWENIKLAFSVVKDILSGFFSDAWEAIKTIWDAVVGYFQTLWDDIKNIFSVVKEILSGFFSDAWEGIKDIWNNVKTYFSERWADITEIFIVVKTWFSERFSEAWQSIKDAFATVKEFFSGIWTDIKSAFNFSEMLNIGKNIVEGLWNGIKNAKDWLLNKIKSFATTITDGIKSFFGIKSPSKVFRDEVGKNLMLGMAEGITNNEKAVTMAMSRVQQGLANASFSMPAIISGNVLPYHINAAKSSTTLSSGKNVESAYGTNVIREEHYYLNETELMTILHRLVKGGERLSGTTLVSGGAY